MVGAILPQADGGLSQRHRADQGADTQPAKPLKQKQNEEDLFVIHNLFDHLCSIR